MVDRRSLVIINGQTQELPSGDRIKDAVDPILLRRPNNDTAVLTFNSGDIRAVDYNSSRNNGEVNNQRVAFFDADGDMQVGSLRQTQYTIISGRFEIDANSDWATWSDPNFGPNLQDWDLDLGNGAAPNADWDGMGLAFPSGAKLNRIFVKCRGNNADIDSIETYARVHDVDLSLPLLDTNAEVTSIPLPSANQVIDLDAGGGQGNDIRSFEIDLGGYTIANDGADLHLFIRALAGSLTGNRQLRCSLFIEWELPEGI